MSKDPTIPDNVWRFISEASAVISRIEADRFSQLLHAEILERPIESPIEQLFLVAMHVTCRSLDLAVDPNPDLGPDGDGVVRIPGVYLYPQAPVGRYKIDFGVVLELGLGDPQTVLVELDGHEFHDRDQRQRSYEKARDRELQRLGHRVLHFTGSDVVRDPCKVAHEVLFTLGATDQPYDQTNPFGLE